VSLTFLFPNIKDNDFSCFVYVTSWINRSMLRLNFLSVELFNGEQDTREFKDIGLAVPKDVWMLWFPLNLCAIGALDPEPSLIQLLAPVAVAVAVALYYHVVFVCWR
jgi:hypothetical protein